MGRPRSGGVAACGQLVSAEPNVLDVADRLIEQLGDMRVVQRVDDPPPLTLTDDQTDVPQQPQLMRHSGLLHPDRDHELGHRMRTLTQLREDQHPARRRQPLHRVCDPRSDLRSHLAPRSAAIHAVAHRLRTSC